MIGIVSAAVLCAGSLAVGATVEAAISHHRRMAALKTSAELLEFGGDLLRQHGQLFDRFVESDAPQALKDELSKLADLFESEESMLELTRILEGDPAPDEPARARFVERLAEASPEMQEVFKDCVITGLLGTVVRWPETAPCFAALHRAALKRRGAVVERATDASRRVQAVHRPTAPSFGAHLQPA